MKLLKVINNGRHGFIFHSYLMYLNKRGERKRYSIVSRREVSSPKDLDGYTAGIIAVITNPAGEVLVSKEFRLGVNRHLYGFPSGMQEKGESSSGCAIREVQEETGIKDVCIDSVTKPEYTNPTMSNERIAIAYGHIDYIQAPVKSDNPNEEIESVWMSRAGLPQFLEDHEEDISLLNRLIMEKIISDKIGDIKW